MIPDEKRILKIFAGNSNKGLAEEICRHLNISLGEANVSRFPDGEIKVKIEESVRGEDVYIIQSTCPPTNDRSNTLLWLCPAREKNSTPRTDYCEIGGKFISLCGSKQGAYYGFTRWADPGIF